MPHPTLVLIGMRGSGKSTVGRAVAERLHLAFMDSDTEIESRAGGRRIPEIFATDGEPHFRALEAATLADLLARPGIVLATGGGCILDSSTRTRLAGLPCVIWLRVGNVATLAARIGASDRPRLTDSDSLTAELAALLAARNPVYAEAATHTLDADALEVNGVVDAILRWLLPV